MTSPSSVLILEPPCCVDNDNHHVSTCLNPTSFASDTVSSSNVLYCFVLATFNARYLPVFKPLCAFAIVFFKNGQTKLLYHETDMKIPIANAIYDNKIDIKNLYTKQSDFLKNFRSLKFESVDKKRFPIVTLLSKKIYKNSGSIILNASKITICL